MEDPFDSPIASTSRSSLELEDSEPINPIDLPSVPNLNHSLFLDPNFDPSEFLLTRRHTALDDLRSELRAYLATLRTSLIEVINSEYEAFIGLSLGLRQASVASSLATIKRPVISIKNEVTRVKVELESMRSEMETVLSERNSVRENKALLRRLLQMEESVEKVEGLLRLGEGNSKGNELDRISTSPAKRLERIAGEYNHMLYLLAKAGDMPFVRSLDPRIARITSTLHLDLSELLTSLLSPSTSTTSAIDLKSKRESLTSILRTYASLNLTNIVEDLIRKLIVRPFVVKTIHRDVLLTAQSPTIPKTPFSSTSFRSQQDELNNGSVEGLIPSAYIIEPVKSTSSSNQENSISTEIEPLVELYNKILEFISVECGLILDISERTLAIPTTNIIKQNGSSTSLVNLGLSNEDSMTIGKKKLNNGGYEILTNVIWDEISGRLMAELGHIIFAAGRPSIFHQNYSLTMAFISRIESLSPTISYLEILRSHPTYSTFIKRFQLPVYFQLRFKEIVSNVEKALDNTSATSNAGGGITFLLGESEAIWIAIEQCWNDEVFLLELASRFWRLTLQLISRYKLWLNSVVPKFFTPSHGTGGTRNSFDSTRAVTPVPSRPSTPSQTTGDDSNDESILRQLTVLIADASLMERKVNALYKEKISKMLPYEDDIGSSEDSGSVLMTSLSLLTHPLIPTLSTQVISILSKRCTDSLKLVRHVASQVRASTKKGVPNEPSYFIPGLLKDLKVYLNGPGRVIEDELRMEWSKNVVDEVATKYAAILASQKKTEDGLRWLKKGKGTTLSFFGRATSTTTSTNTVDEEENKVKLQMQLDVNTLAKDASSLGVEVDKSLAFDILKGLVVSEVLPTVGNGEEVKK